MIKEQVFVRNKVAGFVVLKSRIVSNWFNY